MCPKFTDRRLSHQRFTALNLSRGAISDSQGDYSGLLSLTPAGPPRCSVQFLLLRNCSSGLLSLTPAGPPLCGVLICCHANQSNRFISPVEITNKKTPAAGAAGVFLFGIPKGIRTPVAAVKGRCPRPTRRWGPGRTRRSICSYVAASTLRYLDRLRSQALNIWCAH